MNNQSIGILDSGIGGLTVAKEVIALLPHESVIYIGDSTNAPYGALSAEVIHQNARALVQFLLKKDVKLIVVACNTITVNCIDALREEFTEIPIIGAVPVVKNAAALSRNKRIGILSTSQTTRSPYQKQLIDMYANGCTVFTHGTDALVPLIEQMILDGEVMESVLTRVLEKFKTEKIDTLALGCTHFPLVRNSIQKILGNDVLLLDSGAAIARHVQRILSNNKVMSSTAQPRHMFYTTGETILMQSVADRLALPIHSRDLHKMIL
ncbi:MAG: glutamate racemase [Candidatus Levybacteria bacterium]|nr:glutamate racemase [Candidatus Levybacteria bacterium]